MRYQEASYLPISKSKCEGFIDPLKSRVMCSMESAADDGVE